jgi:hypothetical protein
MSPVRLDGDRPDHADQSGRRRARAAPRYDQRDIEDLADIEPMHVAKKTPAGVQA